MLLMYLFFYFILLMLIRPKPLMVNTQCLLFDLISIAFKL